MNNAVSSDNEGSENDRNKEQEAKMTLSLPVTASLYSTPTKPQRKTHRRFNKSRIGEKICGRSLIQLETEILQLHSLSCCVKFD